LTEILLIASFFFVGYPSVAVHKSDQYGKVVLLWPPGNWKAY